MKKLFILPLMALAGFTVAGCTTPNQNPTDTISTGTVYDSNSWKEIIPDSCQSFNDGCNQCNKMGSGDDAACTRMFCEVYSKPYCTDEKNTTQIANPASSFCIEQGGTLSLSGSTGYCTLPNGDIHEEWEYFRANNSAPEDYVGLSIQEATDLANNKKVPFRVVQIDGQPQAVTMDLRPGRINASVQSGIVTSFTIEQGADIVAQ